MNECRQSVDVKIIKCGANPSTCRLCRQPLAPIELGEAEAQVALQLFLILSCSVHAKLARGPQTAFEEITGDVIERDFWRFRGHLSD
jgi:hypothetical protein